MNRTECIKSLAQLGTILKSISEEHTWSGPEIGLTADEYESLVRVVNSQNLFNPWFTKQNVLNSLAQWSDLLTEDKLSVFCQNYPVSKIPKKVLIVMAGNIPLVGFHDLLCVLLTGNIAVCKLSSDDKTLLPAMKEVLTLLDPEFAHFISFPISSINEIDAVIATGSDNSLIHFEQYFGKYPHLFRKNRTSLSVITGNEEDEELKLLGKDIFNYFGRGCRNVTHLMIPKEFDINKLIGNLVEYGGIIHHHKYANNYDYNRAIYLMNNVNFLDNNFALFRESNAIHSPLSVIHYHYYTNQFDVESYIEHNKNDIQIVIGTEYIPFGQAQCPQLDDFADNTNTMSFLNSLS